MSEDKKEPYAFEVKYKDKFGQILFINVGAYSEEEAREYVQHIDDIISVTPIHFCEPKADK